MGDKTMDRVKYMKPYRNKYLILGCILFLAAALAERIVYSNFGELQNQPLIICGFLRIYPIYNDNGSWFHGRLGIGYIRSLLVFEDIMALLAEVFLFRYIDCMCSFFSLSRRTLMLVACGMSATMYRLFTRIRGVYVLDYLHVKGYGVFDLPDLYLFLAMAGILLWLLPYMKAYHPYKKQKVEGMPLLQKWGWELRFSGMFLQAVFLPKKKWKELFEKWQ